MDNVVSLQEQCLRCITSQLLDFTIEEVSSVPYKWRHEFVLFHKRSLVDLWRIEKLGILKDEDLEIYWDQAVIDRGLSFSGLDFVHRCDLQPPKCKAIFRRSIGGRDVFFQRLWKDLEAGTAAHIIRESLFSPSSDSLRKSQQQLLYGRLQSSFVVEALKLAVDCGFRPSYLSYSRLMKLFKSAEGAETMKLLTSRVIGVNTTCEGIGEEWFENVLANPLPTLKLSVHYDTLCNIRDCVLKCGTRKKLDELIVRIDEDNAIIEDICSFTNEVILSHFSHLRLLEISSLYQSHWAEAGGTVTLIVCASPLVWFLQQPNFHCLRLSGVISTTLGRSLIFTFLSTRCTSQQRLELRNMVLETADSSVQSLPERNDYYIWKYLLIDSICTVRGKEWNGNGYTLNMDEVKQLGSAAQFTGKEGSMTSWLFKLPNLKIGTLQLYDYDTNCTNITVPSTVCIETLKVFIVFKSDQVCYTWTSPLFTSVMQLPLLCKCTWDIRTFGVPQNGNQYLRYLSDVLLAKKYSRLRTLELSISIDRDVIPNHLMKFNTEMSTQSMINVELNAHGDLLGETLCSPSGVEM
ncbi:hypothetical protein EMCRGX_G012774 [Ephydatia muelleri]|eukprot:Em0004g351a